MVIFLLLNVENVNQKYLNIKKSVKVKYSDAGKIELLEFMREKKKKVNLFVEIVVMYLENWKKIIEVNIMI